MIRAILVVAFILLGMLLPYLPGRHDASSPALSMSAQVASFASLLFVPVGLGWMVVGGRRRRRWYTLAFAVAGLVVLAMAMAMMAANHFALGLVLGIGAISFLGRKYIRTLGELENESERSSRLPLYLVGLPILLVVLRFVAVPRAAEWSRARAIEHSAPLIAEIESFRERRGHYPDSLQSLNRDFPTGVVGIERFCYEPNGEAYNLYFVRASVALDAQEVVMFNPRDEHHFASHELDILQYEGEELDLRRGDRRRTPLPQPHWISILFD